jgi:hypothetical protein
LIWAFILLLIGMGALGLAISDFRDFKKRDGDFSEWIVSDATRLNRRLWRANAWTRMLILFLLGFILMVSGVRLMIK